MNKLCIIKAHHTLYNKKPWKKRSSGKNKIITSHQKDQDEICYSIGSIFKIDSEIYILACHHGVCDCINIFTYMKDNMIELKTISILPEYDLALLKSKSDLPFTLDNYFTLDAFDYNIKDISNFKMHLLIHRAYIDHIEQKYHEWSLTLDKIFMLSPISDYLPKVPYLAIDTDKIPSSDLSDLCGLSGSIATVNGNIVGIVTTSIQHQSYLCILHVSVINRFIMEYIYTKKDVIYIKSISSLFIISCKFIFTHIFNLL